MYDFRIISKNDKKLLKKTKIKKIEIKLRQTKTAEKN